jgi:hypothetical protein
MEITQRLKEIIKQETNTDINIRTRKRQTIEIRSLYCTVLKQLKPKKTLQSIGDSIELNHATVIHALKNYKTYEKYNPELKEFKKNVLSYFTIHENELKNNLLTLHWENQELKTKLKQQIEKPKYEFIIIDELNNLLINTKGTIQNTLITDRLEAFYKMNKNMKI